MCAALNARGVLRGGKCWVCSVGMRRNSAGFAGNKVNSPLALLDHVSGKMWNMGVKKHKKSAVKYIEFWLYASAFVCPSVCFCLDSLAVVGGLVQHTHTHTRVGMQAVAQRPHPHHAGQSVYALLITSPLYIMPWGSFQSSRKTKLHWTAQPQSTHLHRFLCNNLITISVLMRALSPCGVCTISIESIL